MSARSLICRTFQLSMEKMRISGKIATEVALQARKRLPIKLLGADGPQVVLPSAQPSTERDQGKRAPPRVRKPSPSRRTTNTPKGVCSCSFAEHRRTMFVNVRLFAEIVRSDPVENLGASYPDPATGSGRDPSYNHSCRADKAPEPDRAYAAV